MRRASLVSAIGAICLWAGIVSGARGDEAERFFEGRIRPILAGTCFRCHGDSKTSSGLRVDSREALLKGGDSGPAIDPAKAEASLIVRAVQRQADVSAMPPEKDKALRPDQVADLVSWIKAGAPWPARAAPFAVGKHWAFEPLQDRPAPDVTDRGWLQTSIDRFIRARQESQGVRPTPPADRLTLIRRATFDLTGLPPTPDEIEVFLADDAPAAFARLVDRLLDSPAYGERWGRHWLDVVRYADTAGETADYPVPLAWRYRNYVITAWNADKPYDEFLREQIAGDILATQGPREKYAERVTATGYVASSRRFGFDSENYHHLTIQDTIDNLGQAVLGLSLGCARCHDHKFDPLTMRDYYALYGIFDSSRYAFPGSEQKQKFRAMVPLVPPAESLPAWRAFDARVAALSSQLAQRKQPVPGAVLRSLHDLDGDFEMQAPAAGGSKGVLVPPWLYAGKIAVTNAAQSPFKNLYPQGRVGAAIGTDATSYHIAQALYPRHAVDDTETLYVNLDFRIAAGSIDPSVHQFSLGVSGGAPAVEILIGSSSMSFRDGTRIDALGPIRSGEWQNLQLTLDLKRRMVAGRFGSPGAITEIAPRPLAAEWRGAVDLVELRAAATDTAKAPAIEFDNVGVQTFPIAPVSIDPPALGGTAKAPDWNTVNERLQALIGFDGDFEMQVPDSSPAAPWNPGPNSVVQLVKSGQSPYRNVFAAGELGIFMPNRGEYDGFGLTLAQVKPADDGRLFVGFDFRCANQDAGGGGSWRYYLGHGPGHSAAIELYFNGREFFRRSGDAREGVAPLRIGQWYQVQLTLDLKARTYTGRLSTDREQREFHGQFATGWDGIIDYTFMDSYGHLGGVRPALNADNFVLRDKPLPAIDGPAVTESMLGERRAAVADLRRQLVALQRQVDDSRRELDALLANGPLPLTYGMAEGTPHNVRMQLRGEPDQPGDEIPRGFIKVLGGGSLAENTPGSGRLELATWLTRAAHPLTARVIANRVWQYHFGQGIVKTPNDFGARGQPPTHPELLDYLAHELVRNGWSIKSLHRLIMLSATYQQASPRDGLRPDAGSARDLSDLYASFPRRRLSAEEIRDAILAVSGELDGIPGQQHPFPTPIGWGYSQHGPFSAVYDHNKRSVYLMTQRLKRHPFLALFDGADPNSTTAIRLGTTVPTQALFFMNDPFVHAKSEQWARHLIRSSPDEGQRIERAWWGALGRQPTPDERSEAGEYLANCRLEFSQAQADDSEVRALASYLRVLLGSNEFVHVD